MKKHPNMYKLFFLTFLIFAWNITYSQEQQIYPVSIKPINLTGFNGIYIKCEIEEANVYNFKVYSTADETVTSSFTISPYRHLSFSRKINQFTKTFSTKITRDDGCTENCDTTFKDLFDFFLMGELIAPNYNYKPVAGELCVEKTVEIHKIQPSTVKEFNDTLIKVSEDSRFINQPLFEKEAETNDRILKKYSKEIDRILLERELLKKSYEDSTKLLFRKERELDVLKLELDTLSDSVRILHVNSLVNLKEGEIRFLDHRINIIDQLYRSNRKKNTQLPVLQMHIEWVKIEINEGFIENIQVVGKIYPDTDNERVLKFANRVPFGFSRKSDFNALEEKKLFCIYDNVRYVVRVAAIISNYFENHEIYRRDYSPENQVIAFTKEGPSCKIVYKEATYKILEAKVFTDLEGISEKNPNGLIQTEISRKFNLNTHRSLLFHSEKSRGNIKSNKKWLIKNSSMTVRDPLLNFGFLSHIEPIIIISKLEQNNRYLNPIEASGDLKSPTINIKQHEQVNIGIDWNIFTVDVPSIKSLFLFNNGLRFGRTAWKYDTLGLESNTQGVNSFQSFFEILMQTKADERYGVDFAYKVNYFKVLDENFKQITSEDIIDDLDDKRFARKTIFNTFSMTAYLNPSVKDSNGRLFFRYRLNWQFQKPEVNFSQIQLGYSFYILKRAQINKS